jgi:hypothetical protein
MPLVSQRLRRSDAFLDDFRVLLSLPPEAVTEVLSAITSSGRRDVKELASIAAKHGIDIAAVNDASGVLAFFATRVDEVTVETLAGEMEEVAAIAEASLSPEFVAVLQQGLYPDNAAARARQEEQALAFFGGFHQMRFRPTAILTSDDPPSGIAGLLCELHYHDSDGAHHDLSFALTVNEAMDLASELDTALTKLRRMRDSGSIQISNRDA